MQKQLRIISRRHLSVCPFSLSIGPLPSLPAWVFSKHIGRQRVCFRYRGTRVFALGRTGWYLHCSPVGFRQLSALPF